MVSTTFVVKCCKKSSWSWFECCHCCQFVVCKQWATQYNSVSRVVEEKYWYLFVTWITYGSLWTICHFQQKFCFSDLLYISSYIFVIRTTFLISNFAVIFISSSLLHFALFCLPGTTPDSSSIMMHSLLLNHFAYASSYPVGGASEIAMNIIPVIERAGGRVFVRANGKCFYVDILSPMFILTLLEFKYFPIRL